MPQPLNPLSLAAAHFGSWLFFTTYAPLISTLALLAMAAFLRELGVSRPAALSGGLIYAWQGDLLPFVYPGHYGYITSWPFFAIAAWGALRAQRTRQWAYAVISGVCCGIMVGLLTNADRGGIASLLIGALYLAPMLRGSPQRMMHLKHLVLCVAVAFVVALGPLLGLYKSNIENVNIAGTTSREVTYKFVTQFSLGPAETLTYLVPGFFGWHIHHAEGPYWGWIGEWPDYPLHHEGTRNLNTAISTTGTIATFLALVGIGTLLPGELFGPTALTARQRFYGRLLFILGFITLVLSWGWHTGFYRPLFALPLMDKWRNPLKWLEMTNFAMVVLSALGVQQVISSLDESSATKIVRSRLAWFSGIMIGLLVLGWASSYALSFLLLRPVLQSEGYDPFAIANIIDTMHGSFVVAIVLMVAFCVVLAGLWRLDWLRKGSIVNPWLHRLWQAMLRPENVTLTLALALAVLAVGQLGWVTTQFITPKPIHLLTDSNPLLDALRHEGDTVRVSVATQDDLLNFFLQNQFAAMDISSLDISAASRIPTDLNVFLDTFDNNRSRLWFLAGVKNVAVPGPMMTQMQQDAGVAANIKYGDGYALIPSGSPDVPSHAIVGMKDYLAKATLVPRAEYFTTNAELLARLKDPAWNPRESVLLEPGHERISEPMKASGTVPPDKIDLETYTPTEIVVKAQSTLGAYLLVNDQYDPDWHVEINGKPAELLRADFLMRAVVVPPGTSTITMRYATSYRVGGWNFSAEAIQIFSDGAMIGAWLVAAFALRRRSLNHAENPLASQP